MLRAVSQLADAEVAELFLEESGEDAGLIRLSKPTPLEQLIANLRARRGEMQCSRLGCNQTGKRRRAPL